MSKLAELKQKTNAEWLRAFKPCTGQVSEQDWTGTLVDLFSPDYFSADRKSWDTNPNSRRFIDLRDGQLQISEDLGDGSRGGRRFDPTTTANPILVPTSQLPANARHMSFLCKFTPDHKAYKDAMAGAFEFTGVLGTAFGEKVMRINTLYNGKGGPVAGFVAPPDEFNFWLFVKPSYTELPYHREQLPARKAFFDYCDSHANHYLSMAEVDKGLFEKYSYGGKPVDGVKKCMLQAFDEAKNYGGDQKGEAADFVEHKEFRIFLELFVKKLDGVHDHKPEAALEDLKGAKKKKGTTTCCGGCVIA